MLKSHCHNRGKIVLRMGVSFLEGNQPCKCRWLLSQVLPHLGSIPLALSSAPGPEWALLPSAEQVSGTQRYATHLDTKSVPSTSFEEAVPNSPLFFRHRFSSWQEGGRGLWVSTLTWLSVPWGLMTFWWWQGSRKWRNSCDLIHRQK